jgi:hypothetical protein
VHGFWRSHLLRFWNVLGTQHLRCRLQPLPLGTYGGGSSASRISCAAGTFSGFKGTSATGTVRCGRGCVQSIRFECRPGLGTIDALRLIFAQS